MNLSEDTLNEALGALCEDGDVFALRDGFELRLRIEHEDEGWLLQDRGDCYGWTEKFCHDFTEGHVPRPDDMDGSARKIQVDRGSYIWWQPADDMTSAAKWGGPPADYEETFRQYIDQITDLLRFGFSIVAVEVWQEVEDVHGATHHIRVDSASMGGVDSIKPEHIVDIVSDLLADLADL